MRRQQDVFVARLINPPFLALLFWLFFARLDLSPASAQTRVGVLQELSAMPFVGMLANVAIFPVEKRLFYYEYKSSARYSVGTFLLAYSVQEVFVSIVGSLLFSIIMVYGIGLQSTSRIFVEFWMSTFCLLRYVLLQNSFTAQVSNHLLTISCIVLVKVSVSHSLLSPKMVDYQFH